ncbi:CRISPR-associated helicase/endonuclease Cas3 [Paenibacillus sp. FSL H7-0331]|uniref:CRISPR-associated helicase/endonuclease Cas3 n=1 Tax=Paenibacillus sp. FSL H7-0331 TaxID=1920421 RepID=UPI00096C94E1|nr:CRISPR-associated helicase/endonuclease Cas3 [Paenibacillus sp. FSL H7-0331]OMF10697.1 CRISPR-associated helicase/endonuclease Cas3 [Paenibacillus sp. FSL H7-0331]
MNYIAHIRESDSQIQSVEEHLLGVKALAESYGEKIGVKHIAGLTGMLHDMGKYTHEFREYILEAVNNPDSPPRRGSVDHSTAGGKLLYELFHEGNPSRSWILAEIVGNAIISHHSYLHDFLDHELESPYLNRVRKPQDQLKEFERSKTCLFEWVISETELRRYVSQALAELEAYLSKPSSLSGESKLMFLTKFIFSALIDADRTNTRLFEENKAVEPEQNRSKLFDAYYKRVMAKINSFQAHPAAKSPINTLRQEMSDRCDQFAEKPSGIYSLSIPTGGGKTLASLRYALKHATREGKKHIIYVVPFTTIIEQNAEEIRKILLDDEHILEHHSNVVDDADDNDEDQDGLISKRQKLKLAKDNWDYPIIFTTMVQFLNVFYAKGSRNIRRLHNLSESVIIFDEVQKVPVSCVSLFNQALNFLKSYACSCLILCTATQPTLGYVEQHKLELNGDAEIIPNLDQVIEAFKRVEIVDRASGETFDNEKLADFIKEKMDEVRSVLVILNTKSVVKKLYRQMEGIDAPLYHLSTSMCAAHRNHILGQVREHLVNNEKVICISTQLIEAGVDVSFDCVIRSLAGLDSIAQAAGRCNRHGKREIQQVYVIDHLEENLNHLQEIKTGKKLSKRILIDLMRDKNHHGGHMLSVQAMDRYFKEFYTEFNLKLNYFIKKLEKDMTELLVANRNDSTYNQAYRHAKRENLPLCIVNSYGTAAEYFRVIDDHTTSVVVPYNEESKELIAQLNGDETIEDFSRLLRKTQKYTINLFRYERDQLAQSNGLVSLLEGKIFVLTESAYHKEFGLDLDNDSQFDLSMY